MDKKTEEIVATQELGDGTENNPILISDADGLIDIRNNLSAFYKLVSDIDLDGIEFIPIGASLAPFKGGFDGDSYTVRNLKINSSSRCTGLFGYASNAVIKNLRLEEAEVKSSEQYTGALCGYLRNCFLNDIYAKDISVSGKNTVGGLIGFIDQGSINKCCIYGNVSGNAYVGGLVGTAEGKTNISNSYSMGNVISAFNSPYTGGLLGYANTAVIRNCYSACSLNCGKGLAFCHFLSVVENSYYDAQRAGIELNDEYNACKLTVALTRKDLFEGWNFEEIWNIEEGVTYPYLKDQGPEGITAEINAVSNGAGTEKNPYIINTIEGLNCVRYDPSGWYKLMTDIDMKNEIFIPIGTNSVAFTGNFDGTGHVIKNLNVKGSSYVGVFGYAQDAVIKNLNLEVVQVNATGEYAGSLAGFLRNCMIDSITAKSLEVSGQDTIGGLVGEIAKGNINKCCIHGNMVGKGYIGGLAGKVSGGTIISDSYSMGSVISISDSQCAGGLLGYADSAVIKNCYSACSLNSGKGLAYSCSGTIVENSYYDAQRAGIGLNDAYNVGKLTVALTRKDFFEGWDFEEIWNIKEGITYPYLRNEGTEGTPAEITGVAGGTGIEEDPYLIETVEGLKCVKYDLVGNYKIIADIDMKIEDFVPIGSSSAPFQGRFDGSGHAIRNLKINENNSYLGIFGQAESAIISNMKLEDIEIVSSRSYVGALAGYLKKCSINGIVAKNINISGDEYIGGVAGNIDQGKIEKSCSFGSVYGKYYVGGLAGAANNDARIENCYAIGNVTSTSNNSAGLIGKSNKATIKNCYSACSLSNGKGLVCNYAKTVVQDSYYDGWKAQGIISDSINICKLPAAFTRKALFKNWDFEKVWSVEEGITYPYLKDEETEGTVAESLGVTKGAGIEEDPYQIEDAEGLKYIQYDLAGIYKLVKDIDMENKEFTPVGTYALPFAGVFDGNGYNIKNLSLVGKEKYTGLFGYAKMASFRYVKLERTEVVSSQDYTGALAGYLYDCNVENVRIKDVTISGNQYVGGLTGYINNGNISGCCIFGSVAGYQYVGGIIGEIKGKDTKATECCVQGSIEGRSTIGGFAGRIEGKVSNIFIRASVMSVSNGLYIGGLAGYVQSADIENCYSASQISKGGYGLVSRVSSSTIQNSFFDSDLANITTPATQARTTEQMLKKETYTGWDMENIWKCAENTYPVLKKTELISKEPFELTVQNPTWTSAIISWQDISGAEEYEISYGNKTEKVYVPEIFIEDLLPDKDYEFRVLAKVDGIRLYSQVLKIKTGKLLSVKGLYCTEKGENSISLAWTQIEEAESYLITYNGNIMRSKSNACMLTELDVDTPYVISVKALLQDGNIITGNTIVVKLYDIAPKTEYAAEFIEKCEGQMWFIDEVENLLNMRGKNINSIKSQQDLATIYAIDFKDRNISGDMPAAIGEFRQLKYLYPISSDHADIIMKRR